MGKRKDRARGVQMHAAVSWRGKSPHTLVSPGALTGFHFLLEVGFMVTVWMPPEGPPQRLCDHPCSHARARMCARPHRAKSGLSGGSSPSFRSQPSRSGLKKV